MNDPFAVSGVVTEDIRNDLCMFIAFPSLIPQQRVWLEPVTILPGWGAVLHEVPFCITHRFLSVFMASNLSQLRLPGAGIRSFALPISRLRLAASFPNRFPCKLHHWTTA